jgi:multimeric flavodoxin WrbA
MLAYLISDGEFQTALFQQLDQALRSFLLEKGFTIEQTQVNRGDFTNCAGCFGCWVKRPGECVVADGIDTVNRMAMNSDLVVYLCPVVFGQFSANIKTVIDRWLQTCSVFYDTARTDRPCTPALSGYPKQI